MSSVVFQGTPYCYTFIQTHANKYSKSYRCQNCADEKKKNGSKERMKLIKVIENEFVQDPCSMKHVCHPKKYAEEMGNRIVYEKAQNVRRNPGQAKKKPVEIFRELLTGHYDADNEAMEDEIKAAIRRTGYKSRRRVLS
ncbi:unnamed protein product [Haemonchus placei]|uniref:Phage protein n=1 Tax=Haemonchus placei TaxID=6290 RepID=A0A0N4X0M3_HAEPC|nr:unnamed protein product [Haemonchus placei]